MIVKAFDGQGGSDTQIIRVTVTNVNEAPTITSDGGAEVANLSMAENSTALTTVHATDPDVGQTLTYTIETAPDSPDATLFTIDANTGALSFLVAPDFEHPTDSNSDGIYGVIVKASDGQGGSDTQIIRVTVTNVNEPSTGGVAISSYARTPTTPRH